MEYFDFNNYKIAYHISGKGFPVILLHGFCEDLSMWNQLEPVITNKGYQFISVNLPGFGESDVIPDISIDGMAEMLNQLFDHLGLSHLILLGHSMGGYITLSFAALFSKRLKGIGLIHSHPYPDSPETKLKRDKVISFLDEYGSELYAKGLIPRLFPPEFVKKNSHIINNLVDKAAKLPIENIATATIAMRDRADRTDILKTIEVPVLFIVGKEDKLESQDLLIQQTHLPNVASIHILENVGHMGPFEVPETINHIISEFPEFCLIYK